MSDPNATPETSTPGRGGPPLTYAVGDVHGRFDLLERALALIEAHGGPGRRLIFLGDYVDRGPMSRAVVERLMSLVARGEALCLKGNHEAMMVDAMAAGGGRALSLWEANGGAATLESYAVGPGGALDRALLAEHSAWLDALPLSATDDHRIFVHAGLAPGVAVAAQREETLLWIREAFLRAPAHALPAHVVHGHTPLWLEKPDPAKPELLPHRTNLDTGAFATGVLTIGVFDRRLAGGPIALISARADP